MTSWFLYSKPFLIAVSRVMVVQEHPVSGVNDSFQDLSPEAELKNGVEARHTSRLPAIEEALMQLTVKCRLQEMLGLGLVSVVVSSFCAFRGDPFHILPVLKSEFRILFADSLLLP